VARIVEGDPIERAVWIRVTTRAAELRVQMMRAQASHTAEQVSLLFRRHG